MPEKIDLPKSIPIFPLPKAILLPRSRLPLHIFEPRYLAMIEDCLKTPNRLIGMVQPTGADDRLHSIGCAGKLTQFSETEDGRYMITLTGVSRYRIENEIDGFTPYRRFNVSWDSFEKDRESPIQDSKFDRKSFFELLKKFLEGEGLSTDWETLQQADNELLINSLSMMLDFDLEDKQALLEAPSLQTRRETLTTLFEFSLRGGSDDEVLQ
ncbi:MAG: LON peptidase substrate-binding domain-containing protein [Paracoccaceae bacterium]